MIQIKSFFRDLDKQFVLWDTDRRALHAGRAIVDRALGDGNAYYGINTGFGPLARKRIAEGDLEKLQRNLLLSHAVGVGENVPLEITRVMLQLKAHSLWHGYSGISDSTFQQLLGLIKHNLIPVVPKKGSLGASGDLAPLSHLCLPLIGEGEVWDKLSGKPVSALVALTNAGMKPITLKPKDGLSLINGTQLMSAYGSYVLHYSQQLVKAADIIASMTVDAMKASLKPFDPRIQAVRPHPGQIAVGKNVVVLLADSQIMESHRTCDKVQDQYSLRCVPQVHGASRDALSFAADVVEREINSVTDNPLVFEDGEILSGGNFHGQPLALALDFAAIALAELASISERRLYLLTLGQDGLPSFLALEAGLNSGIMIVQYTAASLVSENKVLCHPASVDSIPSSIGQEDHVSMGSISATKLYDVFGNVEQVLAFELLAAAQALDIRQPLRSGRGAAAAHDFVRSKVSSMKTDKILKDDIESCRRMLRDGSLVNAVEAVVGELQ